MRYDVLLADADGTLFNFHAGERAALEATLQVAGMECGDELADIYSRVNLSHWKRLERGETTQARLRVERFADFIRELDDLGIAHADVAPETLSASFVQALGCQRVPMPGAEAFLRRVSSQMPVYLVTNGIASVQRNRFQNSELRVYLTDMLISEELGHSKPDPFMVQEAMRRAGVTDVRRAVLLGDSVTADIGAANNAGVDSILLADADPMPADSGATCCVRTLAEAADFILGKRE